ncbi:LemA family protein [Aquimarina muelleri]|uniref:LemA family protein n=1 Tax=Aquimarina muelleri TaxID=279356 RepID=UPI003F683CF8
MIFTYNRIVKNKNQVEYSYQNIDIQLKKRFESIPNIVASVQKYLEHEKSLFERISMIRTQYNDKSSLENRVTSEIDISKWLSNLKLTLENYPDLKAIESVIVLQKTINELAEQISAAERGYNASVLTYNNSITVFPNNILSGIFNFRKAVFLEIAPQNLTNPDVSQLLKG